MPQHHLQRARTFGKAPVREPCAPTGVAVVRVRLLKSGFVEGEQSMRDRPLSESCMWGLSMEGFERPQGHEMPDVGYSVAFELFDLVALCNAAESVGRGNMVWLGWEAGLAGEVQKNDRQNMPIRLTLHCVHKKGRSGIV